MQQNIRREIIIQTKDHETNPSTVVLGGRYKLLQPIGHGGMSTVYQAEDIKLPGKTWAVKHFKRVEGQQAIPLDEISVLLQLNHPYLPHIVDYFPPHKSDMADQTADSNSGYLVMELIDGITLEEWLEPYKNGILPPLEKTLEIGIQILELLQYLHSLSPAPIIFRDLKPSNLMLDKQGKIRLIDFGIARTYKPGQAADTVPLGTLAFAAPEQLNRVQTDPRSDLYSLGALLYYLFSGGRYFARTQKPIHNYRDGLPPLLSETIHRMLQAEPEDRFSSASEVKVLFQQVYHSITSNPTSAEINSQIPDTRKYKSPSFIRRIISRIFVPSTSTTPSTEQIARRKIIAVGSLYAGAGATFTTIAMARTLSRMRIPVVVLEAAVKEPELAALIQLPPHSLIPTDPLHSYYDDEILSEQEMSASNRRLGYINECIRWLTLNPTVQRQLIRGSLPHGLDYDHITRILARTTESFVLIDVGESWMDEGVRRICMEADDVLVVMDPFPSKWNNERTRSKLESLETLAQQGSSIQWIVNKDVIHGKRKERLASAPASPLFVLPYISAEQRLQALDQGKLVQDLPGVRDKLTRSLSPYLMQLHKSRK